MSRFRQMEKMDLSGTQDTKREPLVSVIIPIYNVEPYLNRCLESICGQTLRNIEIICINDGSTDRSEQIMNAWAEKDCRIIARTFENGGQAIARNRGISIARGKYVYFMDSDDTLISDDVLKKLYEASEINKTEIVMFGAVTEYESEECRSVFPQFRNYYKRRGNYQGVFTGIELFAQLKRNMEYSVSVPCLFFRSSMLKNNKLLFYEGITHEDELFVFTALLEASRVMCLKKEYYVRLVRKGSTMTEGKMLRSVHGKLIGGIEMCNVINAISIPQELQSVVIRHVSDYLYVAFNACERLSEEERNQLKESMDFNPMLSMLMNEGVILPKPESWKGILVTFPPEEQMSYIAQIDEKKPLLTVFMPVYNAVSYLDEALESLLNQTMANYIDILCIDDGSTDGSAEVLDRYAAEHHNIRVIHQENMGHGKTVNRGIREAKTEFIGFLDADDRLKPDALATMFTAVHRNRLDFVRCDMMNFVTQEDGTETYSPMNLTGNTALYGQIMTPFRRKQVFLAGLHNVAGVYERAFLIDNGIFYGEKENASCQDVIFWFKSLMYANKIAFIHEPFYEYRRDSVGSLSQDPNRALDIIDAMKSIHGLLEIRDTTQAVPLWDVFQKIKYLRYVYALTKVDYDAAIHLINTYSEELKNDQELSRFDMSLCGKEDIAQIKMIKDSPALYLMSKYNQITGRELERQRQINLELRQLWFRNRIIELEERRSVSMPYAKVAVVMPVYNAEDTLEATLSSVLSQTLEDIQVLCVDDGSTDDSLRVLYEWMLKDARIHVFFQKNAGAGPARNHALENANAEYVAFMDADDQYALEDSLEALYQAAKESDAQIVGGWRLKKHDGVVSFADENPPMTGMLKYSENQIDFGYQTYIFSLKMIRQHNLWFPNFRRYQDPPFFVRAMVHAQEYLIIDKKIYVYNVRPQMVKWTSEKLNDYARGLSDELDIALEYSLNEIIQLIYKRFVRGASQFAGSLAEGNTELYKIIYSLCERLENAGVVEQKSKMPFAIFVEQLKAIENSNKWYQRQLKTVKDENATLQKEKGERWQQLQALQKEKRERYQQLQALQKEKGERWQQLQVLQKEKGERWKQLQALQHEKAEFSQELAGMKKEKAKTQSQIERLTLRNRELEQEVKRIQNSRSYRLSRRIAQLSHPVVSLKQLLKKNEEKAVK